MKDPHVVFAGLEDLLERIEASSRKGVVLVEGRRDERALRELGIGGEIVVMNQGLSLLALCEELSCGYHHVAVLVDWDPKGEELARKLRGALTRGGLEFDLSIRDELRVIARGSIHAVEELSAFHRRVRASAEAKGPPLNPSKRGWKEIKEEKIAKKATSERHASPRGRHP